jgi:hypothetical protein
VVTGSAVPMALRFEAIPAIQADSRGFLDLSYLTALRTMGVLYPRVKTREFKFQHAKRYYGSVKFMTLS